MLVARSYVAGGMNFGTKEGGGEHDAEKSTCARGAILIARIQHADRGRVMKGRLECKKSSVAYEC